MMFCNFCVLLIVCLSVNVSFCAEDIETNVINKVDNSSEEPSTSTKPNVAKVYTQKLVCPSKQTRVPFFSPSCRNTRDCLVLGPNLMCCHLRCLRGVPPPNPEPRHTPIFGLIDRVCPADPMPEFLDIQECKTDADCGNRICCPERPTQGVTAKNYCRNGAPRFNRMPAVKQFLLPMKSFASYLQCTPPPPPVLDLFPRPCQTLFDCFPSLCCQENGKRVCRPPKKSLLALVAITAQRLGSSSLAKSFIQRIS